MGDKDGSSNADAVGSHMVGYVGSSGATDQAHIQLLEEEEKEEEG